MAISDRLAALRLEFCATHIKKILSREPVVAFGPQFNEAFLDDVFCFLAPRQWRKILPILEDSDLIGQTMQIRGVTTPRERRVDPSVEFSPSAFKILMAGGHPSGLKLATKIIASIQYQTKQDSVSVALFLFFF